MRLLSKKPRASFMFFNSFLLLLPFGIEQAPGDTAETNLRIAFGHGNYASIVEGCEDYEPRDKDQLTFTQMGLQLDHKVAGPLRLGIRGSYILDEERFGDGHLSAGDPVTKIRSTEVAIINPFVALEWRYLSFGGGYVYNSYGVAPTLPERYDLSGTDRKEPLDWNCFLRIGSFRMAYVTVSLNNSFPFYSKGYLQLGAGAILRPGLNAWAGLGIGPYEGLIIGALEYDVNKHLAISASAALGESEGIIENSIDIGLKVRIPH